MKDADIWILSLVGVCAFFSVIYCIMYWCRLCKEEKEREPVHVIASYDAQLPEPPAPCEPGFEFEMAPPSYEEAVRVYNESIATYGLRQRYPEDVRVEDLGGEFDGNQGGDGQNGDRNGDGNGNGNRNGGRNGNRNGDGNGNGDKNGGRNGNGNRNGDRNGGTNGGRNGNRNGDRNGNGNGDKNGGRNGNGNRNGDRNGGRNGDRSGARNV